MKYCYDYPRPCVTVDCVVFRKRDSKYEVLLIQRKHDPFKGIWALPGGFIEMDEELIVSAKRELEEETGLKDIALEQLYTFDAVHRDPRARTIGIAFYGFAGMENSLVKGGDDAYRAQWFLLDNLPELAFDHADILKVALQKINLS